MTFHERYLVGCAALAVAALVTASPTRAQAPTQPENAALNAEAAQNDWPTYHGTYKSYHYSGLDQINTGNVKNLEVAWMHSDHFLPAVSQASTRLPVDVEKGLVLVEQEETIRRVVDESAEARLARAELLLRLF